MPTETGTIDLKAQKAGHDAAAQTATSYITEVTGGGIKVHDANDSSDFVQITSNGMDVYNDGDNVARFGSDGAQIGLTDESHLSLDYRSMQLVDKEGDTYFHVSDLRGANSTTATITERFTGNGTRNAFLLSAIVDTVTSVTIDGHRENYAKHDQMFRFGDMQILLTRIDTSITPPDGSIVEIVYTSNEYPKVYTFGSRASGNVGMMSRTDGALNRASALFSSASGFGSSATGVLSHAEGASEASGILSHAQNNGTKASSYCQTAMGKYNVEDTNDDYALIIGNGTADNARSNAATVSWTGDVSASTYALANGSKIIDTATNNIHLITPDAGTSQAEYSVENTGKVYVKTRTRSSSSAAWGAWSSWTKIAG